MKQTWKIRLSAVFLLVTFSLNPIIGFACSMGLDLGYNSRHHAHNNGEEHQHNGVDHPPSILDHHHDHEGNNSHSHQKQINSHQHSDGNISCSTFTSSGDGNCCNDLVVDFQTFDKAISKSKNEIRPLEIKLSSFLLPTVLSLNSNNRFTKPFRIPSKNEDLPPPDLPVLIHSFLI